MLVADLGAHGAHLAVVDLSQTMRAHGHVDIDVDEGPDTVLAAVESHLRALRAQVPGDAPARAVVIGVPGPVDGRHGIPVRPPIMPGWHAYPVAARLRRTFGCPVLLENDVNLRALGEARALPADQAPLLFVKVGTGIGGGLITGAGELHHGADGAAGDIGHVRVRGGPDVRCVCGNVGCIEALASAGAIARRLGVESGGEATIADVRALVARGDPTVLRLVREAAELIGEVVATLVHFYNPARVTIGGSSPPRATTCSPGSAASSTSGPCRSPPATSCWPTACWASSRASRGPRCSGSSGRCRRTASACSSTRPGEASRRRHSA